MPPTSSTAKHAAPAALHMAARDVGMTAVSGSIDMMAARWRASKLSAGGGRFDRFPPEVLSDDNASASAAAATSMATSMSIY